MRDVLSAECKDILIVIKIVDCAPDDLQPIISLIGFNINLYL